jgi:hypothetical protein
MRPKMTFVQNTTYSSFLYIHENYMSNLLYSVFIIVNYQDLLQFKYEKLPKTVIVKKYLQHLILFSSSLLQTMIL